MRLHAEDADVVQDAHEARAPRDSLWRRGVEPGVHGKRRRDAARRLGQAVRPPGQGVLQGRRFRGVRSVPRPLRREPAVGDPEPHRRPVHRDHLPPVERHAAPGDGGDPAVPSRERHRLPRRMGPVARLRELRVAPHAPRRGGQMERGAVVLERHPERLRPGAVLGTEKPAERRLPVPRTIEFRQGRGHRVRHGEGGRGEDHDRRPGRPDAVPGAAREVPAAGRDRGAQRAPGQR